MRRYIMVRGVSFRQNDVEKLELKDKLHLVPEPDNPHDEFAIKVIQPEKNLHIGYVPRELTDVFHKGWAAGYKFEVIVESMGEAKSGGNIGVKAAIDIKSPLDDKIEDMSTWNPDHF